MSPDPAAPPLPPTDHDQAVAALADRWLPRVVLGAAERASLRRNVIAMGAALGVVDELHPRPFEPATQEHQVDVIAAAADAMALALLGVPQPPDGPFSLVVAGRPGPVGRVVPAGVVDLLDVNAASAARLADLPGLGPASARRVVARRDVVGPYTDLDGVRRAARMGPAEFAATAGLLTVAAGAGPPLSIAARDAVVAGGFAALLALCAAGGVAVPGAEHGPAAPGAVLAELTGRFARLLRAAPLRPRFWAPDRERMRRAQRAGRRDARIAAGGARDVVGVAPVFSAGYRPLLLEMCAQATGTIQASVFYFTAGSADHGPGDDVLDALAAAVARGVDVRIVLDDDVPTDPHGAHTVNGPAAVALAARGIPVRLDHLDVTAHAKAVVVDRRLVLVGSHNWTASSFFRYQETSCLVESAELGARMGDVLARRWQLLAPAAERVVGVEVLETIGDAQRAAVVAAGLADGPVLLGATRLPAQRRELAPVLGLTEPELVALRRVVGLMQELPVSETVGVALVAAGLTTPRAVLAASAARLRGALDDLGALPDPFGLRRVLPQVADRIAALEA